MRLRGIQRSRIEAGEAMVYTARNGVEYYIESVYNIHGELSPKYRGMVYAYDGNESLVTDQNAYTANELLPFASLDECKQYLDTLT